MSRSYFSNNVGSEKSSTRMAYNGQKRLFITLLAISLFCIMAFSIRPAKMGMFATYKTYPAVSSSQSLRAEDLVQNEIYYFADHGNGLSVAKFDKMQGENIYTKGHIKPLLQLYQGPGLWGTIYEAGDIRLATLLERIQLLLSMILGIFVPYP